MKFITLVIVFGIVTCSTINRLRAFKRHHHQGEDLEFSFCPGNLNFLAFLEKILIFVGGWSKFYCPKFWFLL